MVASLTTSRVSKAQASSLRIRTGKAPAAADHPSACKGCFMWGQRSAVRSGEARQDSHAPEKAQKETKRPQHRCDEAFFLGGGLVWRRYCCCGGLLGGFGVLNPPLDGAFGLFCIPEGDVPKPLPPPKLLPLLPPLPVCPLRLGVPCWPNPCSWGWYGVMMMPPRSIAGS